MAGSFTHCLKVDGGFTFDLIENMGDAHEACHDMFWMVRVLAKEAGMGPSDLDVLESEVIQGRRPDQVRVATKNEPKMLRCDFCSKTQREVNQLVASDSGVHICNECAAIVIALILVPKMELKARRDADDRDEGGKEDG